MNTFHLHLKDAWENVKEKLRKTITGTDEDLYSAGNEDVLLENFPKNEPDERRSERLCESISANN